MAGIYRILHAKWNPPKPSTASFEGKTILITAATGGLGLAAANKLVAQGTSTLIVTGRDEKKSAAVKTQLQQAHPNAKTNIIPLPLEMGDAASINAFIDALKRRVDYLDHAILNAGLIETKYKASSSGWENTIQVNAISTILLSLLTLPLLAASPSTKELDPRKRPHLVYISSGTAWMVKPSDPAFKPFMASSTPLHDFCAKDNFPPGGFGGSTQYGRSKYILEHCFRRVAALPYVAKSNVVVTSVCPGMCRSDLGRQFTEHSAIVKAILNFFLMVITRPAEDGANIYITGLEQGSEAQGEMWKDDKLLHEKEEVVVNMKSREGKEMGDKLWKEMQDAVKVMDQDGRLKEVLVQ